MSAQNYLILDPSFLVKPDKLEKFGEIEDFFAEGKSLYRSFNWFGLKYSITHITTLDIFKTLNRYDVVARFTEMRKEDPYQDGAFGGLNSEKLFARLEKQKLSFEQTVGFQYFMQAMAAMLGIAWSLGQMHCKASTD